MWNKDSEMETSGIENELMHGKGESKKGERKKRRKVV